MTLSIGLPIGATAPPLPIDGQLWHDSTNNVLKVYRNGAWQTMMIDQSFDLSPRVTALELQRQLIEAYDADVELGLSWPTTYPTLSFQLPNELETYLLTVVNPDSDEATVDYVELRFGDHYSKTTRRLYSVKQVLDWLNLRNARVKIPQPTADVR